MQTLINENKTWIDDLWQKIDNKLSMVAKRSYEKLPYSAQNGIHDDYSSPDKVSWWTNGFWGGMLWLMYKETGKEIYKSAAEHSGELLDYALDNYDGLHHDVGFMWHLTAGADYRITGNKKARNTNLFAAATLASRYNIEGGFIRAWNDEGSEGWTIIDCLMNIPLLYWASKELEDDRFTKIAMKHADMALRDHIRADGSVNHIVEHDTKTGDVIKIYGGQGYDENSCWSRGLAWAVYGSIISYKHTGKKDYLDTAIKTANYFISNCVQTEYLPLLDFRQPKEPLYYDSTAGLCTACGLLEISKCVSEQEGKMYTDAAIKIIRATAEKCCNLDEDVDYIVGMGSERYPFKDADMKGIHIPIIYGDFFMVEALLKLRGNDFLIW